MAKISKLIAVVFIAMYGAYNPGETATFPEATAQELIRRKKARLKGQKQPADLQEEENAEEEQPDDEQIPGEDEGDNEALSDNKPGEPTKRAGRGKGKGKSSKQPAPGADDEDELLDDETE